MEFVQSGVTAMAAESGAGCDTVAVEVAEQPLPSVTLTVYVLADSPENSPGVFCAPAGVIAYTGRTAGDETDTVPSAAPLQLASVADTAAKTGAPKILSWVFPVQPVIALLDAFTRMR